MVSISIRVVLTLLIAFHTSTIDAHSVHSLDYASFTRTKNMMPAARHLETTTNVTAPQQPTG